MRSTYSRIHRRPGARSVLCILAAAMCAPAASAQWQAATGIPAGNYIRVIESIGDRLFAGTFRGLYRSEDGGKTWIPSGTGLKPGQVFAITAAGSRILAGTDSGCFASTDGGNGWALYDSGLDGKVPTQFVPAAGAIYAGVKGSRIGSGYGVYRSSDNGATWVPSNKGIESARPFSLIAVGNVLLMGAGGTYRSDDAGATWTASPTGAERDIVNDFAFANGTLYAAMYSQEMCRSSDTGKTWTVGKKGNPLDDLDTVGRAVLGNYGGGIYIVAGGTGWEGGNAQPEGDVNAIGHDATHVFVGAISGAIWRRPRADIIVGIRPWAGAGFPAGQAPLGWFDANGRRFPDGTPAGYNSFPLSNSKAILK